MAASWAGMRGPPILGADGRTMASMTGPAKNPPPGEESSPPPPPLEPTAAPPAAPAVEDFGARMKALGEELGARGEQLGREAQAVGDRWSRRPGVTRAADTASRVWGLVLLLFGLYFLVQVTFGYALPDIPWGALWPAFLIV